MNSQWNTASRTAGIEQLCSGIRFTGMWGKTVSTLGAVFCDGFGGSLDPDGAEGVSYRRLADGDGH